MITTYDIVAYRRLTALYFQITGNAYYLFKNMKENINDKWNKKVMTGVPRASGCCLWVWAGPVPGCHVALDCYLVGSLLVSLDEGGSWRDGVCICVCLRWHFNNCMLKWEENYKFIISEMQEFWEHNKVSIEQYFVTTVLCHIRVPWETIIESGLMEDCPNSVFLSLVLCEIMCHAPCTA